MQVTCLPCHDFGEFDTSNITEGSNLYYTNARADARIALQVGANLDLSSKDTDALTEGSTNLYYTDTRADARVAAATGVNLDLTNQNTGDLTEGTNLYYTNARADARIALQVANLDLSNQDTGDLQKVAPTTPILVLMLVLHSKLVQTLISAIRILVTLQRVATSIIPMLVLMQELMQDLPLRTLVISQKAPASTIQTHALMLVLLLVSLENLTHLLSAPSVEP